MVCKYEIQNTDPNVSPECDFQANIWKFQITKYFIHHTMYLSAHACFSCNWFQMFVY